AMISMRLKKFYKKTIRRLQFDAKEPVGFDKTKVECFNCHNIRHFAREYRSKGNQESRRRDAWNIGYKAKDNGRRSRKQEEPKALLTLDGEGVDWTGHAEDKQENFALMAYSNSSSDTEETSCSKECVESYSKLKKLYDTQREQLGDASIEIQAYTQALKKVEAQLVAHQKNQLCRAVKEKEELKTKLENFQSSSKGLSKLLNSQMSTRDKSELGYGNPIHEGVLSYEKEVLESVFDSRSSDVDSSPVNDRFVKVEGMHAVPSLMTGIYMPFNDTASCESNSSVETPDSVSKRAVNEPTAVSKSKVWSDAPIIEEYEPDSDDEYEVIENDATLPKTTIVKGKEQVTPITSAKDKAQRRLEVKARSTCRLQIHQSPRGIFINQAKYALETLKKHSMERCESLGTPLATKPKLDADLSGTPIDQTKYYSMIGSLMYLTSSRPDLVQAVCYCARYQARPTKSTSKRLINRNALIHAQALLENTVSRNRLVHMDVKETRLHCNVYSRSRVRGVICKLCSSNVDEDTT
ncbi:hypothetical protein Tco_0674271, partial [Tanacetum coccineum]